MRDHICPDILVLISFRPNDVNLEDSSAFVIHGKSSDELQRHFNARQAVTAKALLTFNE